MPTDVELDLNPVIDVANYSNKEESQSFVMSSNIIL